MGAATTYKPLVASVMLKFTKIISPGSNLGDIVSPVTFNAKVSGSHFIGHANISFDAKVSAGILGMLAASLHSIRGINRNSF
ncbi:hypothetical protein D3C78_1840450 [compost metagenome]